MACIPKDMRAFALLLPLLLSLTAAPTKDRIVDRFAVPSGFARVPVPPTSFGNFLRNLHLLPTGTGVSLYNGSAKGRQDVHAAVLDVSVGDRDLQQCADAVMRLRTEYLYASGRDREITFRFTNGFEARWDRWARGERIRVSGNTCNWYAGAVPDRSHEQLLRYLNMVFTYAGTLSLSRELVPMTDAVKPGDVYIHGGSPGHAVLVVDVSTRSDGSTAMLLAQSYMPAQQLHVLKNLRHPEAGAWYFVGADERLYTPEWTFLWTDRRRWTGE
jgi:hypothetical protein